MNMYLWIIPCLVIGVYLYLKFKSTIEGFIPSDCPNCGQRSRLQCSDCDSCGWCYTPNGYGECVPGNARGPFFRQDCLGWEYKPMPTPMRPRYRHRWWWK